MAKTTGIAAFSEGRSDMHRVDPRKLFLKPGWNMRDEGPDLEAHIDDLARSIAQIGVKEPISVKLEDGKLWVTNGHCRTRACMRAIEVYKADIKTVPVMSEGQYTNDAELVLSQLTRNAGKPLTLLEQGKVFKKLLDLGWQQNDIADKAGLSGGRVSQILALWAMPEKVKSMVVEGTVSASLAKQVVDSTPSAQAAVSELAKAAEKAQDDGREKVKPSDLSTPAASATTSKTRYSIKQAFENSDIDNSEEPNARGVVIIEMPVEDFEQVRKILGL